MRNIPSEEVQISAQLFAVEMAKHLVRDKGVNPDDALARSMAGTRQCLVSTGVVSGVADYARKQIRARALALPVDEVK